jgi:hypothetical protein
MLESTNIDNVITLREQSSAILDAVIGGQLPARPRPAPPPPPLPDPNAAAASDASPAVERDEKLLKSLLEYADQHLEEIYSEGTNLGRESAYNPLKNKHALKQGKYFTRTWDGDQSVGFVHWLCMRLIAPQSVNDRPSQEHEAQLGNILRGLTVGLRSARNTVALECHEMHSLGRYHWHLLMGTASMLDDFCTLSTLEFSNTGTGGPKDWRQFMRAMYDAQMAISTGEEVLHSLENTNEAAQKRAEQLQNITSAVKKKLFIKICNFFMGTVHKTIEGVCKDIERQENRLNPLDKGNDLGAEIASGLEHPLVHYFYKRVGAILLYAVGPDIEKDQSFDDKISIFVEEPSEGAENLKEVMKSVQPSHRFLKQSEVVSQIKTAKYSDGNIRGAMGRVMRCVEDAFKEWTRDLKEAMRACEEKKAKREREEKELAEKNTNLPPTSTPGKKPSIALPAASGAASKSNAATEKLAMDILQFRLGILQKFQASFKTSMDTAMDEAETWFGDVNNKIGRVRKIGSVETDPREEEGMNDEQMAEYRRKRTQEMNNRVKVQYEQASADRQSVRKFASNAGLSHARLIDSNVLKLMMDDKLIPADLPPVLDFFEQDYGIRAKTSGEEGPSMQKTFKADYVKITKPGANGGPSKKERILWDHDKDDRVHAMDVNGVGVGIHPMCLRAAKVLRRLVPVVKGLMHERKVSGEMADLFVKHRLNDVRLLNVYKRAAVRLLENKDLPKSKKEGELESILTGIGINMRAQNKKGETEWTGLAEDSKTPWKEKEGVVDKGSKVAMDKIETWAQVSDNLPSRDEVRSAIRLIEYAQIVRKRRFSTTLEGLDPLKKVLVEPRKDHVTGPDTSFMSQLYANQMETFIKSRLESVVLTKAEDHDTLFFTSAKNIVDHRKDVTRFKEICYLETLAKKYRNQKKSILQRSNAVSYAATGGMRLFHSNVDVAHKNDYYPWTFLHDAIDLKGIGLISGRSDNGEKKDLQTFIQEMKRNGGRPVPKAEAAVEIHHPNISVAQGRGRFGQLAGPAPDSDEGESSGGASSSDEQEDASNSSVDAGKNTKKKSKSLGPKKFNVMGVVQDNIKKAVISELSSANRGPRSSIVQKLRERAEGVRKVLHTSIKNTSNSYEACNFIEALSEAEANEDTASDPEIVMNKQADFESLNGLIARMRRGIDQAVGDGFHFVWGSRKALEFRHSEYAPESAGASKTEEERDANAFKAQFSRIMKLVNGCSDLNLKSIEDLVIEYEKLCFMEDYHMNISTSVCDTVRMLDDVSQSFEFLLGLFGTDDGMQQKKESLECMHAPDFLYTASNLQSANDLKVLKEFSCTNPGWKRNLVWACRNGTQQAQARPEHEMPFNKEGYEFEVGSARILIRNVMNAANSNGETDEESNVRPMFNSFKSKTVFYPVHACHVQNRMHKKKLLRAGAYCSVCVCVCVC